MLVGSTGSGKSTLGNFLVNPDNHHILGVKQTFETAQTNLPQTQTTSTSEFQHEEQTFTVIDTPGLNESAWKDLSHMIDIVKVLRTGMRSVRACVLCTKFNAKVDAQYKATIEYYSRLLPTLFEGNVVVVMTSFSTDERSVTLRKNQNIDEEKVKENTIAEVKEIAGLSYRPQLFTIDCLPIDRDECEISMETRRAILDYIAKLHPIPTADVVVAKTEHLKQIDDKECDTIHGEIVGYNKRLKQANDRAAETFAKIEEEQVKKSEKVAELVNLRVKLRLNDSDDLVTAGHWGINREWKLLTWLCRNVNIDSPWKIVDVQKWTNGKCQWTEEEVTEKTYQGKLQGMFMRGLYASVTLKTTKRDKYAPIIAKLYETVSEQQKQLDGIEKNLKKICMEHSEFLDEISDLNQHLEACLERIRALSTNYLSLKEAEDRLLSLFE